MQYARLGDYVNIKTGKLDANAAVENGQYPFFTCSKEISSIDSYSYDTECVLVAGNGDLNVKYYNGKFDAYQRTYIIENKENSIFYVKYIYYFMSRYILELKKQTVGGIIKFIKLGNLTEAKIPIYSKEKQKDIIDFFDNFNSTITNKIHELEMLDNLIKSQFIEMFGSFENVNLLPLSNCSKFIDYRGHTPLLSDNGTIRMINAKSVGKGFFKEVDEFIDENTYNSWMKRGFAYAGDVLFVTEGHTFGNVCQVPSYLTKFALGQRVITIQGKANLLNNYFLAQYMQTVAFRKDIEKYKTGGTAQGIRSKDLLKISIPIPNLCLQDQFAAIVKQIVKSKFIT